MKVVVFGAGGDIGKVIADELHYRGNATFPVDHEICDVTSTDEVRKVLSAAWADLGGFDGVVIAHGAPSCIKPTLELADNEWQKIIDVDLSGTFRICREAGRYLCSHGGSIVVLSSMHAIATYPERTAYAAAKAGVCGLVRAMAVEWAHYLIRVNAVLPGQVYDTRRTDRIPDQSGLEARSPSGSLIDPVSVAEACLFLLDSRGINGHSLIIDNGWTASAYWKDHAER